MVDVKRVQCRRCRRPIATQRDFDETADGEGRHLCWARWVKWCELAMPDDGGADESACSNEPDLLVALERQLYAHKRTWLAARASVEGEGVSAVLFENEPSTIAARAAIKKARGGA